MARWQDFFFHVPIYYKAETKFCVSACKSDRVYVHAHAYTKRPTTSKFGSEIQEGVLRSRSNVFKIILKNFKKPLQYLCTKFRSYRPLCLSVHRLIYRWTHKTSSPLYKIWVHETKNFAKICDNLPKIGIIIIYFTK